jgi:hypothetical protein
MCDNSTFNEVEFIHAFETEPMDNDAVIEGFQHLIDSGTIEHLQGTHQRTANDLMNAGLCWPRGWRNAS